MSLRGITIYRFVADTSQDDKKLALELVFAKRYPSVERRSMLTMEQQEYVKMPLDYDFFGRRILDVILHDNDRFVLKSKVEMSELNAPVYEVPMDEVYVGAVLWPVVIIQQGELVATAVCMIDRKIESANESFFLPSVVIAYELLTSLMSYLAPFAQSPEKSLFDRKVDDIAAFLTQCCPFGTPSSTNINLHLKSDEFTMTSTEEQKLDENMAAWRPFVTSGKNAAVFNLIERYNCEMHREVNDGNGQGVISGSLNAICDVTGTLPEVEFELKCDKHQFDAFLVHPCVKEHESIVNNEIKVKLCPPVEAFNVVNYNLPDSVVSTSPLIKCDYTVKWTARERGARVKFQILSAHPAMQSNKLELCEIQFPYAVTEMPLRDVTNVKLSCGSYIVRERTKRFVWTIGRIPNITQSKPCVCSFFIRFSTGAEGTGDTQARSTADTHSVMSGVSLEDSLMSIAESEKLANIFAQVAFKDTSL
ncbi:AP-5 complex subunit mu-1-like [Convolutriloba macropyga]|uniref:AP-5 complex subunit mu-1-like n=1 Tax=Convolutriloba macropyga TaxID=536237 RepID=UPI003F5208D7